MKRFALIVYKAKYGWDNYSDNIYLSGKYDTKEDTVLMRETNSFQTLMKMWHTNLKHYVGYTYCVRDRGHMALNQDPVDNLLVGGVYDYDDEEIIRENFHHKDPFEVDEAILAEC